MLEKKAAYELLKNNFEIIRGVKLNNTQAANVYEFSLDNKDYVLFHRHKNEKGSLMVHFFPEALDTFDSQAEGRIAVLGYTICYINPLTKKEEMVLLISTVDNIRQQLMNPYNSAVIRGEKTNNVIIKFDPYSWSIMEQEADFITARFCI